jgi:hypothetical protein
MSDEYGKDYPIYFSVLFPLLVVKEKYIQKSLNKKTENDLSIILLSFTHTNEEDHLANFFYFPRNIW